MKYDLDKIGIKNINRYQLATSRNIFLAEVVDMVLHLVFSLFILPSNLVIAFELS